MLFRSGTGSAIVYVPAVEGNVDLTIDAVEAEVMSFLVTGVTVASDNKSVIISFSENAVAVMSDANINGGGSGSNVINVKKNGNTNSSSVTVTVNANGTVTISSSDAFENNATIKIDAPIVNASGKQVKASTITLSLIGTTWTSDINNK